MTHAWLRRQRAPATLGYATSTMRFIEQYRSYVVCYPLGRDIVTNRMDRRRGPNRDPVQRRQVFRELLCMPQTSSGLRERARGSSLPIPGFGTPDRLKPTVTDSRQH